MDSIFSLAKVDSIWDGQIVAPAGHSTSCMYWADQSDVWATEVDWSNRNLKIIYI